MDLRFFGGGKLDGEDGVIVDVGSGSVGIAIVHSPEHGAPEIIWSSRLHTSATKRQPTEDALEREIAVLIPRAFDACVKQGIPALRRRDPRANIRCVQVGVCAPWSHTVAKSVHVKHTKPFAVSKAVLDETAAKVQSEVRAQFDTHGADAFSLASTTAMDVRIDGYEVREPVGKTATMLTATYLIDLIGKEIADAIHDASDRAFPSADLLLHSFMRLYYAALCESPVDARDACLVDITNEATEIAIVENGSLVGSRSIPIGSRDVARSLAKALKTPLEDALARIRENDVIVRETERAQYEEVTASYEKAIAELLRQHSERLTVPKTIFLHVDARFEPYCTEVLARAARAQGKISPRIHPVTSELYGKVPSEDTALLLSAHVFHSRPYQCTWD